MKSVIFAAALTTLVSALPVENAVARDCPSTAVLFARGTTELPPYGSLVGPQFIYSLKKLVPEDTTYYGVVYPAGIGGYLIGGSPLGSADMQGEAEKIVASCPDTKLIMSGYSQGAQITHKALEDSNLAVKRQTRAVILFGDPLQDQEIPGIKSSKIATYCAFGDTICSGLPIITASHLAYSSNANEAAEFATARLN